MHTAQRNSLRAARFSFAPARHLPNPSPTRCLLPPPHSAHVYQPHERGSALARAGTTDASEALEGGAIATFGGHKGAGLALCVELLAGVLSGGAVLGQCESKKVAKSWGHTLIAIQPEALVDDFEAKAASVLAAVKASGPSIRLPGESSAKTAAQRTKEDALPIPTKIWESICHTAEHGLPK